MGGGLGTVIGAVACLPILQLLGALDENGNLSPQNGKHGFFVFSCMIGALVVAGSVYHYFTTKERVKEESQAKEKLSFFAVSRMLAASRSWWLNAVFILMYGVMNVLIMNCVNYYATYVLGSTAQATPIQGVFILGGAIALVSVGAIDSRLGRRKAMMIAALVAFAGRVPFIAFSGAGFSGTLWPSVGIYINSVATGIATTYAFVLFSTNRNQIVDILQKKHGRRVDAMIASTDNLISKLATAGATAVLTLSLGRAGFNGALPEQPRAAIDVLNFFLGWAPLLAALAMLAAAHFMRIEQETANAQP
jgi:Na+/melibiose symporter-like transporter